MASPTQWTWVLANSGRQWRTGKPGVLQSMGSQRIRHDLAIKQQLKMKPYDRLVFSQEEEESELFSFLCMRTQWEDGHLWAGNGIKWHVSLGHPCLQTFKKMLSYHVSHLMYGISLWEHELTKKFLYILVLEFITFYIFVNFPWVLKFHYHK